MFRKWKYRRDMARLAEAGVGEGDFGEDHSVPADLIQLGEVLEWQAACREAEEGR